MHYGAARYQATAKALRDAEGRALPGYFNDAAGAVRRAVVVVHDFFGLTPYVRGIANRLSKAGFLTFAPDLYRGQVAETRDQAASLARRIAWNQVAVELGLAVSALRGPTPAELQSNIEASNRQVGILGFAMGGAAALVAAAAVSQCRAVVTYYGIPQDVSLAATRVKIQGHFANQDRKCTPERVDALEASLRESGVDYAFHRYDADNGFANAARPEVCSPADAELAWERTLSFLTTSLA
jgi:carboxymethylenebutenolidase